MTANALPELLVDIVADPVCPWCYVGLQSFLKAQENLSADFDVTARLRPYQLNPDTPVEGVDRHAYYREKFPDQEQLGAMREMLKSAARAIGFDFDPAAPALLPNTLKAHQLMRWALPEGKQLTVATAIYRAFWNDLADIGDDEVLGAIAADAGMDGDRVRAGLAAGEDANAVRAEALAYMRAGVTGVPTFIVGERTGFSGGMPPAKLEAALRHAADLTEKADA
jgi:predicted DsbA family dithiol-disulfide isomerase